MAFELLARDAKTLARAGVLHTSRGPVETPVFMPVATQATVKALTSADLAELGVKAILANAYHLYLRPGTAVVEKAGGLHAFMNYPGAILTDSGGFQVMSLAGLRSLDDDGVTFKSHLDGSPHRLTPESVIDIEDRLGADMWTSLDECPPYPCSEQEALRALERTQRWTERAWAAFSLRAEHKPRRPMFFPIIQGSLYPALRREAAERLRAAVEFDGVSLGGFSVGEPKAMTWEVVAATTHHLPEDKPRYLMGVGTPQDLWDAVACGVDMLDCVWPTRVARHGWAVTRTGKVALGSAAAREDFSPVDPSCACKVCKTHSRAYLAHLYRTKELSVHSLVSYHNVHLLLDIAREIRRSILEGRFAEARARFLAARENPSPPAGDDEPT